MTNKARALFADITDRFKRVFIFPHERKMCWLPSYIGYNTRSIFVRLHFARKLSSLDRLYGCRPFFLSTQRNPPEARRWLVGYSFCTLLFFLSFNKHRFWFFFSLFLFTFVCVYISSLPFRRCWVYKGINQIFSQRSLCVRMHVLCVRVLIFITIHISRPVQKRKILALDKKGKRKRKKKKTNLHEKRPSCRPHIQSLRNWDLFLSAFF